MKIQLIPTYIKNGRLLEIGCSHGQRLEYLKNLGWNVKGIEMNKKAAEFARERDLKVFNKRIEEVSIKNKKFDAVVMNMVLEHLYDLFGSLRIITKWIKSGGQLIFSIPYCNGLESDWFKQYYYELHLPTHVIFLIKRF